MTASSLLDTPRAAAYLGLSPHTLATIRVRGGGPPFVKLGRRVMYRASDLEAFIEARVVANTAMPAPGGRP